MSPQKRSIAETGPEEIHYRLLKRLEERPDTSQRELAAEVGVSLGKLNYCLKALMERGWVTVGNFRSSNDKLAYTYFLTPHGVAQKARLTVHFLQRKLTEYERIKRDIDDLRREAAADAATAERPGRNDRNAGPGNR